ncbi:exonuclease SbcC [uncultured Limosilactobacillus sp.]|uniref:exonuclease SbcC n=1 Tax=uncultured Limosilactobacillus sp. TaxID=2837629 RepID=UPI0025EFE8E6|nr:exonuclease SbcC [uncultured Limosilactobacillus sp.]
MSKEELTRGAQDISQVINRQISSKIEYLQGIKESIESHNDRRVFQLLDNRRYAAEIEHREQQPNNQDVMNLVDDLADQLSTYLSANLIDYLGHAYPFFYYEEYQTGHFRIYFGNWWDRRQFGELDVLNLRFVFNQDEYKKLSRAFELQQSGKRYNSARIDELSNENDHLQDLLDHAGEREQKRNRLQEQLRDANSRGGLFESSKAKESRHELLDQLSQVENEAKQAENAAEKIKENEKTVLELSKENTILSYEMKSITDTFGGFEEFELANRKLYADYLKHLSTLNGGKQVAADEQ